MRHTEFKFISAHISAMSWPVTIWYR